MRKLTNLLGLIPFWLVAFISLWIFMFIVSIPALPFLLGKAVDLTCNRLEINYVNCQYHRVNFYGLWTEPTMKIRLKNVVVKKYEIQHEDSTSTGYKLYLNNEDFYDYGSDAYRVHNDKQHLENFRLGTGNSYLNLKLSKGTWGEIALIPVGFMYVMATVFGIGFIGINLKRLANKIF
ncbi:MAG: hypothetical protein KME23_15165 [Goleter apudmare HA4340-LM2]|jgi:hypothetical protein|nr:hypothetical protein [Goleter apudmare HA4340-LM2]